MTPIFRLTLPAMLTLFLAIACARAETQPDCDILTSKTGETTMPPSDLPLAFGLTSSDLPKVRIVFGYYSTKTGAGKQEITITGDGKVTLLKTQTAESAPETMDGMLPERVVAALLATLEEQQLFALDDHYPFEGEQPSGRRALGIELPDRKKLILMDRVFVAEFERCMGALKLAAGLAVPQALNHQFFPNL